MKKFLFTLLLLAASVYSYGQLNPVANLTWYHGYEYPYNFYNLQWTVQEVAAEDTLRGYNVYRNNVLWRFQPDSAVYCMPVLCPDPDFLLMEEFWIKVTAVYNYNLAESAATDSILDHGIAIGMTEKTGATVEMLSNPVHSGESIRLKCNTESGGKILLLNSLGQVSAECSLPAGHSMIEWNACYLRKGMYYLRLNGGNSHNATKIIVQ
jgi:hypothetical protein